MNLTRAIHVLHCCIQFTGIWAAAHSAVVDDYPSRPVKVIVPFAPGGGSDTFVRIVQGVIQQEGLLEQPLVVINVPGAGGTIGSRRVKDVEPDGYTILNLHDGILSAKLSGQVDYGPEAFKPIAATGRTSSMVCVKADSRWQSLQQLLQVATDEPETVKFAANLGALSHFDALRMEQAFEGAKFRYVPTGGGAKRFGDLLGDHVDLTVFNVSEFDQFREGGLRALAIFASERHPDFPEVPTARECGVNVVRDSMQYWWAPKETPQDCVDHLVDMLRNAMATEALQKKLAELKMDPVFLTGRELQSFLTRQELAMSVVGDRDPIQLPNTPMLLIVMTTVLGIFAAVEGRKIAADAGNEIPSPDESQLQDSSLSRAIFTLTILLLFCLLFSLGSIPFWLLSSAFIVALGLVLLERTRRNLAMLFVTALIMGPGCFFMFTKVLTIDLP